MLQDDHGHVVRALTVAGSDSGGGAGIQADLKTMHQFGVYGMSVISALTAQNTVGVQGVIEVNADFVGMQLQSVLSDFGTDAMKTGMLANESIMEVVHGVLCKHRVEKVVVDPVMVAKGGEPLISASSIDALKNLILPMAEVITPNIPEAATLCGYELNTWRDCHNAVQDIAGMGARTVVLKGGHMSEQTLRETDWDLPGSGSYSIDIAYRDGQFTYFLTPRVESRKTHGTGCTFSAAIASMLARGVAVLDAIATAKAFIYHAIDSAREWDVGHGHGPTDHSTGVIEAKGFEPSGVYCFDGQAFTRIL